MSPASPLLAQVGVTEASALLEPHLLEACVRDVLNKTATRAMAVLDPLKVTITNMEANKVSTVECVNNPVDETAGTHKVRHFPRQGQFLAFAAVGP